MKNTKKNGQVSILVLQNQKADKFLAICYEFAIVLEGTNEKRLISDMQGACEEYVKTVNANNLSDRLLSRQKMLPKEYKQLFEEFERRVISKKVKEKLSDEYENAFKTGRLSLTPLCV